MMTHEERATRFFESIHFTPFRWTVKFLAQQFAEVSNATLETQRWRDIGYVQAAVAEWYREGGGPWDTENVHLPVLSEEVHELYAEFKGARGVPMDEHTFRAIVHEGADVVISWLGLLTSKGIDAGAVIREVMEANQRKVWVNGRAIKPASWQPADVGRVIREGR